MLIWIRTRCQKVKIWSPFLNLRRKGIYSLMSVSVCNNATPRDIFGRGAASIWMNCTALKVIQILVFLRSNTFTKNAGEERTFQIPELSMPHQSNYTGAGVVKSQVGWMEQSVLRLRRAEHALTKKCKRSARNKNDSNVCAASRNVSRKLIKTQKRFRASLHTECVLRKHQLGSLPSRDFSKNRLTFFILFALKLEKNFTADMIKPCLYYL